MSDIHWPPWDRPAVHAVLSHYSLTSALTACEKDEENTGDKLFNNTQLTKDSFPGDMTFVLKLKKKLRIYREEKMKSRNTVITQSMMGRSGE